jgi:hypothetical protein
MDQKVAALPHCDGRIEENTAAAVADSDDRFWRPGGAIGLGARGEKESGARAFYRCRRGEETVGINRD